MSEKAKQIEESINVDRALEEMEKINQKLSAPELPLSEALALYKQGVELAAACQSKLEGVEKELKILNE